MPATFDSIGEITGKVTSSVIQGVKILLCGAGLYSVSQPSTDTLISTSSAETPQENHASPPPSAMHRLAVLEATRRLCKAFKDKNEAEAKAFEECPIQTPPHTESKINPEHAPYMDPQLQQKVLAALKNGNPGFDLVYSAENNFSCPITPSKEPKEQPLRLA